MFGRQNLYASLKNVPYPFAAIPVEVAERRLQAATKLVEAFADMFAVVMLETNEISIARQKYQGETPTVETLTETVIPLVLIMSNAMLQQKVALNPPQDAMGGAQIVADHFANGTEEAHSRVRDIIETRCGVTMSELMDRLRDTVDALGATASMAPVEA